MKTLSPLNRLLLLLWLGWSPISQASDSVQVKMSTNQGDILLELYPQQAPKTVENFLSYVNSGFYQGTQFHRVIANFMIQGGGFDQDLQQKPTRTPIPNEARADLPNQRGTLAMARTSDPHSATAQFFINLVDNAFLNHRAPSAQGWGYCVFGRVIEGMAIVDAIGATKTGAKGQFSRDVPQTAITITAMTVIQTPATEAAKTAAPVTPTAIAVPQ